VTLIEEGPRLVQVAAAGGLVLRLFGGVAIWYRSAPATREALGRGYGDLDYVAHRKGSRDLRDLLEQEGYAPERTFNAAHGDRRLIYHAPDGSFHIDVFLDHFEMSHALDFSDRLEAEEPTLPAADLLLAKLQVAEINHKDLTDTAMLLLDHELGDDDGPGRIGGMRLEETCGGDWGLFTTVTDNLTTLDELAGSLELGPERVQLLAERSAALRARLDDAPKTRAWRMRAKVGRRKRWYEVPEEVHR
jgi:hypothetical protein